MKGEEAIDHLLIGAPTLETGVAWLEARTGVRAVAGGSHPGLGTWNALASLGPAQYIEIIAPDPAQGNVETLYIPGLRRLDAPKVVTWAAKAVDLATSPPRDLLCAPALPGARTRPDGTRLSWTLLFPKHRTHGNFAGALPFLIEWERTDQHPGKSTPPGLTLRGMSFGHPEPDGLKLALTAIGIEATVDRALAVSIRVELDTPLGVVVLSS